MASERTSEVAATGAPESPGSTLDSRTITAVHCASSAPTKNDTTDGYSGYTVAMLYEDQEQRSDDKGAQLGATAPPPRFKASLAP